MFDEIWKKPPVLVGWLFAILRIITLTFTSGNRFCHPNRYLALKNENHNNKDDNKGEQKSVHKVIITHHYSKQDAVLSIKFLGISLTFV